jgi:hypothetical protein
LWYTTIGVFDYSRFRVAETIFRITGYWMQYLGRDTAVFPGEDDCPLLKKKEK